MKKIRKKQDFLILKIIMILLSAVVFFLACLKILDSKSGFNGKKKQETIFISYDVTFEYDSPAFLYDLFSLENGKVISENTNLDTRVLGPGSAKIEYIDSKEKHHEQTLSYTVADTTPPVIICGKTFTLTQGQGVDFTKSVVSGDICDANPKREIIGIYDANTLGEYPLTYQVTDASGNVTAHEFTLRVVEESSGSQQSAPYYHFNDFVSDYQGENRLFGIDVSTWQGDIDWYKVKASGVSFAMMRIGYQGGWGGEPKTDGWYLSNIEEAKAADMDYLGVYFYSYATTTAEARHQAQWVVDMLGGTKLELGIAFDWESFSNFNSLGKSFTDMNDIARAFFEVVEANGYRGVNYGSLNFMNNIWSLPEYETWLAHYAKQTSYQKDHFMWQLSSTGKVEGIGGYCDLNIMYIN